MAGGRFRFDRFTLDPHERRLLRDGAPVDLSARYFDALALLVREQGRLVSKDRFLEEVWRGAAVTDEALTQCVRALRRALDDDAGRPRFIETVPKHGYRFIAPVAADAEDGPPLDAAARTAPDSWRRFVLTGAAGTLGGGAAGICGGLFYSVIGAAQAPQPMGAVSALLVLVCLSMIVGLLGGAGVGFGVAAAGFARRRSWLWTVAGGAAGGLLVGAVVKLVGVDAFALLFGQAPGDITGAPEGALLGAAVGLGAWLAARGGRGLPPGGGVAAAGLTAAAAGITIHILGGRLMAGSLDLLARTFPDSRLYLGRIGTLFGETGFGPVSQVVTGGVEGALFGVCVVGAMVLARRRLSALRP